MSALDLLMVLTPRPADGGSAASASMPAPGKADGGGVFADLLSALTPTGAGRTAGAFQPAPDPASQAGALVLTTAPQTPPQTPPDAPQGASSVAAPSTGTPFTGTLEEGAPPFLKREAEKALDPGAPPVRSGPGASAPAAAETASPAPERPGVHETTAHETTAREDETAGAAASASPRNRPDAPEAAAGAPASSSGPDQSAPGALGPASVLDPSLAARAEPFARASAPTEKAPMRPSAPSAEAAEQAQAPASGRDVHGGRVPSGPALEPPPDARAADLPALSTGAETGRSPILPPPGGTPVAAPGPDAALVRAAGWNPDAPLADRPARGAAPASPPPPVPSAALNAALAQESDPAPAPDAASDDRPAMAKEAPPPHSALQSGVQSAAQQAAQRAARPDGAAAPTPYPESAPPPETVMEGARADAAGASPPSRDGVLSFTGLSRATLETTAMVAAQIVRRLETRSTRFEMALTPEGLGRVDVSLEIDGDGRLAARLAFDNPAAAAELRGRADELRRQLEASGFQIGEDALEFAEREGRRDQPFDRQFDDRRPGRAFDGARRLIDDASSITPPARWAALSLTPEGVDMKV